MGESSHEIRKDAPVCGNLFTSKPISPDLVTTVVRPERFDTSALPIGKEPNDNNRVISGKELCRCFDELKQSFGTPMVETITYELETMFGIILIGKLSYRISKIQDALTKLLGISACEIIMEAIVGCLDDAGNARK